MWSVAFKAPGGRITQHHDSGRARIDGAPSWTHDACIDSWIADSLSTLKPWTGWLMYNDEIPCRRVNTTCGHAKGVVVWNESEVGWLVHSLPKFPTTMTPTGEVDLVPDAELKYGQSFMWVRVPNIDRTLPDILSHIALMQANVYNVNDPRRAYTRLHTTPDRLIDILPICEGVRHIAKHGKWGKCIFEDALVPMLGGSSCLVESWMRPRSCDSDTVKSITRVRWGKSATGTSYTETEDHSKWSVSTDSENGWTFVGDNNKQKSQHFRGGGGFVVQDADLWSAVTAIVDGCNSSKHTRAA